MRLVCGWEKFVPALAFCLAFPGRLLLNKIGRPYLGPLFCLSKANVRQSEQIWQFSVCLKSDSKHDDIGEDQLYVIRFWHSMLLGTHLELPSGA